MTKTYADYPFAFSLIAGHFRENSVPGSITAVKSMTGHMEVCNGEQPIFEAANKFLFEMGKTHEELFDLGFTQALGTDEMLEADNDEQKRLCAEHDRQLGLDHEVVRALVDLIY